MDTGADITVIPERWAEQLRLQPNGELWTRGFDGTYSRRSVYYIRLIVDRIDLPVIRCVASDRADLLLGRNVLNRFVITLDGINLTYDLRRPAAEP